jgi:hypothetical protein
MKASVYRVRSVVAALALGVAAGIPTAAADTVTLPPITPGGGGPIIGGGSAAQQGISQQLFSFANPNVVQEVDGSAAAQYITAAASVSNQQLAAPFSLLRRVLTCQPNNAGFGARAFRRNDGLWGGAMVVAAKSATPNVDDLAGCVKTNWRRASAGSDTSMCNSGWATPNNFSSRAGETYYVLLAGTADDFCTDLNGKFKGNAAAWPF